MAVARLSRLARHSHTFDDLTFSQSSALVRIMQREPLTLQELAESEGITPPSMLKTVQSLVELGYVTRRPHETDGRKQLLEITEQGHRAIGEIRERRDAWMQERLAQLSDDEMTLLRAALPAMRRLTERDDV